MERVFCYFISALLLATSMLASFSLAKTNISTDTMALLELKDHITSDPYSILAKNWSISSSVCNWIGVTCSYTHHHRVRALNISNMGLAGSIPSNLGNLSFLVSLDMGNNSFHGHLPEGMAHLRRIRFISLSHNNFTGEIPSWFGFLEKLQHLSLRNNSFTGFLPPPLFNISGLGVIDFSENNLSGIIPVDMCNNLPSLKRLLVSSNKLNGQILSGISKCWRLEVLSLSNNEFSGRIPREVGNLQMLEELYLGGNNLGGNIPKEITSLPNLRTFSVLSSNLVGIIPASMFNMSKLQYLHLGNNSLTGTLPENLCDNLPKIEFLYLIKNKLHGQIPSNIGKCSSLRELSLARNRFTGFIPQEFGNLTILEGLDISVNNLTGEIPKEIGNLTMIQNLYLYENNLTGFIPQEMGKLSKLESLDLELNRLGGPIPAWIFNISTIQFLSLSANSFFGSLPPNMCHVLKNLQGLYLAGNYLSGNIPMSISNCSRLTIITLLSNEFTGSIPDSLGNLRQLNVLQLSDNKLTSESSSQELSLFSSLANCMLIRHISLERNPLNGVLPNSLGNLSSSIEIIYAFGSGIMGSIPGSIGNLSNLIALRLDNNQLTGSIPTSVKGLGKLQGLYLHNNIITGTLSTDLCNLRMLNDFNISQNQISGSIPGCLGNITSIRYIDLSFNKITSSVPISLWNLKDLLELRLTSNFFNGSLAPEIGKLKAVTWLDMSLNHFSGSIPKLMENLTYLTYLNVSSNDLRGEIPSEGPFTKFTYDSFAFNRALCGAPRFHLPPCQTISRRKSRTRKTVLIAIILPGMLSVVIVAGLGTVFHRYKKKSKIPSQTGLSSLIEQPRISYYELLQATNGYSQENLLGVGSFGSVYKGILNDGKILAVKVFNLQLERAFRSFDAECNILRNLRHRNLTKVITSCSNPDFKSLVLEFMPNGSLEKWLHSENCSLDVMQRLNIMIDVACALQYLHHGYTTPVIHCDLKPSNVLLDQDMVAHVSDFGIAKMLSEEETITHTNTLATLGYIAPEYGSEGLVSTKCDVYSYGIMLMEMLTRKRPNDEMFDGNLSLRGWVCGSIANAIMDILDVNLIRSNEEYATQELECISSIMKVALNCSKESPNERSNMEYALAALNHIKLHLLSCYRRP
ncbi:probable LRR receptor-like serine/threonine-protein kinase At3g47570 [Coffea eugenioides]|uniref:probable LRR receptor-like serine/threonine-protein kinase At3g47570 n=1 Tax=Coffea eugenioides TaxID=49369 RepID=UPI000F60B132|nr:probable LRR receptor-like serine/threonine-protein kinase At3g47570 [Coffea eugenioides]